MDALAAMPLWLAAFLVLFPVVLVAGSLPLLVRRWVGLDALRLNNEVGGFKYATLGAIYAVLLAFVAVMVWADYEEARIIAREEAAAILNLDRLARGLPQAPARRINSELQGYARAVRDVEWPAMARGQVSHAGRSHLLALFTILTHLEPATAREESLLGASLEQLTRLDERRNERLYSTSDRIPAVMWGVLLLGAALTVGYTTIFGSPNVRVQCGMNAVLASVIALVLLAIAMMDRPYTGRTGIGPEAVHSALHSMHEEGR